MIELEDNKFVPLPQVVGRCLPHSLEAEEYLLSCCLLDGADLLPRCFEMRISPADFYDPKHGIIYDCIVDVFKRGAPVDVSIIAEELKKTRQLDHVGGYSFLTQVSSRIPTTAQASYFIDRVKEQSLLREIVRSATGVVEDVYGFSGNIEQFTAEVRERMERVTSGGSGALQRLKECEYDQNEPLVDERITFRLGKVVIATAGNLLVMVAQPGVGKSAAIGAMIAATMIKGTDPVDCLGFEGPNYEGLPVLHFDTEQSKHHYQKAMQRILRRARLTEFPAWFHSFHLTGKTAAECRHLVETAIAAYARKNGGKQLFAVIIDGWADLVSDPNDTGECFPFLARFHMLAIKHDCPIAGVLHLNPGADAKSRGHLGSQLQRKAETVLQLEIDDDDITVIWSAKQRGAPIKKEAGPRFQWSEPAGMHASIGDWREVVAARRAEKAAQKPKSVFSERYSREEQVSFYPPASAKFEIRQVIYRRAQEGSKISDSSLDRLRLQFLKNGWISQDEKAAYRRTREGDDWAARKPGAATPPTPMQTEVEF